jgi:hypothetical protein
MEEEAGIVGKQEPVKVKNRPVPLTLLCLFSFTWFALLSLLLIICVFYSDRIAAVRNLYVPEDKYTGTQFFIFFIAGFLLHVSAFAGTLNIWFLRRAGLYVFATSGLLLFISQLLLNTANWMAGVNIALILLFLCFFRKLQ